MSFVRRASGELNQLQDKLILQGGNAPREMLTHNALYVARPATRVISNNAPAQNYRAGMPSNKQVTPVQAAYVEAIARRKIGSNTTTGAASWVSKQFGG